MATDKGGCLPNRDRVPRSVEVTVVAEVAVVEDPVHRERRPARAPRPSEPAELTAPVVPCPARRITEHLVGSDDPLEGSLGGRVASVEVRVVAASEGAEGAPDLGLGGPRGQTQHAVEVTVIGHASPVGVNHGGDPAPGLRSGR